MQPHRPSRTAERVAIRRAAHQLLDKPLVFADPIALQIIGAKSALALRANPSSFDRSKMDAMLRAFLAARSRCAEDELARAVDRGVRQYVLLGAGLDTFAYRNPYPAGTLRVFEVDHPSTQAWKRARLDEVGLRVPGDVIFVAIDFEKEALPAVLATAGFDAGSPACFAWLGVTPYLAMDAIVVTLKYIASAPPPTTVIFDYPISRELLSFWQRMMFDAFARRVAKTGEKFVSSFDPVELDQMLRSLGFRNVEDLGRGEINARYFSGRKDGLHVGSLGRIAIART